jgi:hypothetical protein
VDAPALFNAFEIVLWAALGLALAWRGRALPPAGRRLGRIAAVAFLAFAASDAVELRTGAWWRPWWLFAWKAACVAVLAGCLVAWRRAAGRRRSAP